MPGSAMLALTHLCRVYIQLSAERYYSNQERTKERIVHGYERARKRKKVGTRGVGAIVRARENNMVLELEPHEPFWN